MLSLTGLWRQEPRTPVGVVVQYSPVQCLRRRSGRPRSLLTGKLPLPIQETVFDPLRFSLWATTSSTVCVVTAGTEVHDWELSRAAWSEASNRMSCRLSVPFRSGLPQVLSFLIMPTVGCD
jgi:hypothetical protein